MQFVKVGEKSELDRPSLNSFVPMDAFLWSGLAWANPGDSIGASGAVPILEMLGCEPVVLNPLYRW